MSSARESKEGSPSGAARSRVTLAPILSILLVCAACAGGFIVSPRFALFLLGWALVALIFYRSYARSGEGLDWLSPGMSLPPILFLYSVAPALRIENTGSTLEGSPVDNAQLLEYYLACVLGAAGLASGLVFGRRRREPAPATSAPLLRVDDKVFFWLTILAAGVVSIVFANTLSAGFNFRDVPSYAERAMASRLEMRATQAAGLQEVFFREIPTALILSAACLLLFRTKIWPTRIVGALVLGAYVLTNTLGGWRGAVVWAVLMPVVFYHYRIKRLRIAHVVLMGLGAYLFMNALALVRHTSDPGEMWDAFNDNISANGAQFARLDSTGELMVGGNLVTLIQGLQRGTSKLNYGFSFFTELAVFVPRAIYADRPLPLGDLFTKEFFPEVYRDGGGMGFFCVMEGYWALGLPGAFVAMLAFGYSVEKVYQWFSARMTSDLAALWYHAVYLTLVVVSTRNGIMGTYKFALMSSLPFLLIAALANVGVLLRNERMAPLLGRQTRS